jgi:dihydropteroate synthase
VLDSTARDEVVAELYARGADAEAVQHVVARGLGRAMLVGPLLLEQAQALREQARQAGALAALTRVAGRSDPARVEVVIMGPVEALRRVAAAAKGDAGAGMSAALEAYLAPPVHVLRCRGREIALGERTIVMGILNLTPDSFSGDGLAGNVSLAVERARQMVEDGAHVLDVGGESTRPGAEPVGLEEELARVLPVIERLTAELDVPVSIDTYKSAVAREALARGAAIVNDISGLHADEDMAKTAADAGAAVIVMHIQGTPRDMQANPRYADVIGEISDYLAEGIARAEAAGIARDQIVVDPGIGFGKKLEHNLEILRRLREFRSLGCPVLVGTSRKSMIGAILDLPPDQRVEGTAATVALAIAAGADMVRVHDVKEMARVARVADAIVRVRHEPPPEDHGWAGQGEDG